MDFEARGGFPARASSCSRGASRGCIAALMSSTCWTCTRTSTATPRTTRRTSSARSSLVGTGQLPKFESDLFKVTSGEAEWYLPDPDRRSAGHEPLRGKRFWMSRRRCRARTSAYYTLLPAARPGSYGKDTRGHDPRSHEFDKVELVPVRPCPRIRTPNSNGSSVTPRKVLNGLDFPYRASRSSRRRHRIRLRQDV